MGCEKEFVPLSEFLLPFFNTQSISVSVHFPHSSIGWAFKTIKIIGFKNRIVLKMGGWFAKFSQLAVNWLIFHRLLLNSRETKKGEWKVKKEKTNPNRNSDAFSPCGSGSRGRRWWHCVSTATHSNKIALKTTQILHRLLQFPFGFSDSLTRCSTFEFSVILSHFASKSTSSKFHG